MEAAGILPPPPLPSLDTRGAAAGVTPADVLDLDSETVRQLSDEQLLQLAADTVARSDQSATVAQYVPAYSRLRGLLDLHGFYPDPAVLQRRSTQVRAGAGGGLQWC